MVVLTTKLEVAQHNGDFCARDEQDDEHKAQEAEEVVELVEPHGGEDEEQFNEDCSEGQNAADEDAEERVHVPGLRAACSMSMWGSKNAGSLLACSPLPWLSTHDHHQPCISLKKAQSTALYLAGQQQAICSLAKSHSDLLAW